MRTYGYTDFKPKGATYSKLMRLKGQRSRSLEILHNELANRQVNELPGDCVNIA